MERKFWRIWRIKVDHFWIHAPFRQQFFPTLNQFYAIKYFTWSFSTFFSYYSVVGLFYWIFWENMRHKFERYGALKTLIFFQDAWIFSSKFANFEPILIHQIFYLCLQNLFRWLFRSWTTSLNFFGGEIGHKLGRYGASKSSTFEAGRWSFQQSIGQLWIDFKPSKSCVKSL